VFVFADEWRAQATGYAGDENAHTPTLDALARESVRFSHAVAGCPVCCPYRASLMTGQYPQTHGVFINDVELDPNVFSIARAFQAHGYDTAYIGKWHLYGSPDGVYGRREAYVPRDHQLGFDYWKGFECCHDYARSPYFVADDPTLRWWDGYDAFAQSRDAADYIRRHATSDRPFLLMLSWGPPHFPLDTAPEGYRRLYENRALTLRPNVPPERREQAQQELRGYYAHIAALDDCLKIVWDALRQAGIESDVPVLEDTVFVFTADHGDMRQSQGLDTKLFPFDESIRVPFLLHYPRLATRASPGRAAGSAESAGAGEMAPARCGGSDIAVPIDAPDIMPTLLGLAGLPVPPTVEGTDWSPIVRGEAQPSGEEAALLAILSEFTEIRANGMRAYRGLRTARYTYVRDTAGPWLLFDNQADPYQMRNLVHSAEHRRLQERLEAQLAERLARMGDEFREGRYYLEQRGRVRPYGLAHYYEVNCPIRRVWRSPWEPPGSPERRT